MGTERGFGVIGTGTWGALHARIYGGAPGCALRGVADLDLDRARAAAEPFGATAYDNYTDLLADDSVDAVSIVTPDFAHAGIAVAAAEAGKHILCEKPLATTVEECARILDAAKQAGVKLMVDFHARWSPVFHKAWETVRKGQIGEVQHVYYRLSDRIWVPTKMLSWANESTVMWFIGSHSIDTVRWFVGGEVVRVYAVARSRVLKEMGIDTPDYYQATLEFDTGATAVIENSWIMPDTMPNIIDLKLEMVGSTGAVYADASHHRALEKYTQEDAEYPDMFVMPRVHGEDKGFASDSIRHFARCVVQDTEPMVTGEDGLIVTKIICAIEESVRSGQPVDIN